MELVGLVVVNGGQVGLGQGYVVNFTGEEQVVRRVIGFHHLDSDGVEALHVRRVPVVGRSGQHLFVALHKAGNGVGAIVPQGFPGNSLVAFRTQFLQELAGERIQAAVGGQGGEISQLIHAGINQGLVIRRGNAHHFLELVQAKVHARLGVRLIELLGVLIVLLGALNHFNGHGGVYSIVLGKVQHRRASPQPQRQPCSCHPCQTRSGHPPG